MEYTGSTAQAHTADGLEDRTYRKVAWRLVYLFGVLMFVGGAMILTIPARLVNK